MASFGLRLAPALANPMRPIRSASVRCFGVRSERSAATTSISSPVSLARGCTRRTLAGLVRAKLATVRHQIVKAGGKTVDVGRVRNYGCGPVGGRRLTE